PRRPLAAAADARRAHCVDPFQPGLARRRHRGAARCQDRVCRAGRTPMKFVLTEDQAAIRAAVERICADFGDDYWLRKDREGGFPHDFHAAMAQVGWLGVAMPVEVGGAGLGITELPSSYRWWPSPAAALPRRR